MEKNKTTKVVGFDILEDQCIWAKAGVVTFKRCANAYDCNSCKFDKAMLMATSRDDASAKPTLIEVLGRNPANLRECRHMLTGRVDNKFCDNNYQCEVCDFDQMLDYADDVHPSGRAVTEDVLGYSYCDTYYYHEGHTWARVEFGGRIRIGVDDFAMRLLGRPDKLICPELGTRLRRGMNAFSLEKAHYAADLVSPVNGTVIAVNQEVLKRPELAHEAPYTDGWLVLVEPGSLKESVEGLYIGSKTGDWLTTEARRLRDLSAREDSGRRALEASRAENISAELPEIAWHILVGVFLGSASPQTEPSRSNEGLTEKFE
ncbi:MAG: glycine cleavage system protein H [Syntrophobacteraceae bacterium]